MPHMVLVFVMIAEHDGSTGAMLREYVWLGDMPLALITGTAPAPEYSFIHTGQLDEPIMVTDASQARIWDVVNDPWGNALPLSTPAIAQDLRLPGQSLHIESGLFQNWHRDYDPTLGRYIEADPIGLDGGGNVFAYVEGNPVKLVDLMGLRTATAGEVSEVAIREFLKRQRLPTRRLNKWLTIGDALGTAVGAAYWYCSQEDDDAKDAAEEKKKHDDFCYREWMKEQERCRNRFPPGIGQLRQCLNRARSNYLRCLDDESFMEQWNDELMGDPKLPRPPSIQPRKK